MNIIEIHEMIDLLTNFFHDTSHETLTIGGIVGSHPLSHVLEVATTVVPFESILIIEGCADFTYIPKKWIRNYVPYQYLFYDQYVESPQQTPLFDVQLWKQNLPTIHMIKQDVMQQFELVIVNNAHLVDMDYLRTIVKMCKWKCVLITDPYDVGGEQFLYVPTIVDCLERQSSIIGMARRLYQVSTRAIDKRAPGNVTSGKITKRAIGKSDGRMYISNNVELTTMIQDQQRKQNFRKGQRFFVTDTRLHQTFDVKHTQQHVIGKNCLLNLYRANASSPLPQPFQLHHAKQIVRLEIAYNDTPQYANEYDYHINVKPANILHTQDARYHRYLHTVLVCVDGITNRELYSVMKNSVNLTICEMKGVS